jgi:hypothetical protein
LSDRQNLNWKIRSSGQNYYFWEFIISFYNISWLYHLYPLANCVRKAFLYRYFSVWSIFDCPALFLECSNYMVWLDTCQCNWKSQLYYSFSNSEINLNLIIGRNLDEFSQRYAPCLSFTPQRLGSKPSPWSNAFALVIFI